MKPAWDKLSETYKEIGGIVIADVDCTSDGGKSVCGDHSVRGYPTIKYFTDDTGMAGADYSGGRTFDDFDKFVKEHLAKYCDPATKAYCDDQEKAYVEKQASKDTSAHSAELARLKSLLAAGVKDDGKSKLWILKRTKILEALIGPSFMQSAQKFCGRMFFKAKGLLTRWAMALGEFLEPKIEAAIAKVSQWYEVAKTQVMGQSKGEL